jgi:hypothetical protein
MVEVPPFPLAHFFREENGIIVGVGIAEGFAGSVEEILPVEKRYRPIPCGFRHHEINNPARRPQGHDWRGANLG